MTTLGTGATGFIGSELIEKLLAQGQSVRALVRDPARAGRLRDRGVELVAGNVLDVAAMEAAIAPQARSSHPSYPAPARNPLLCGYFPRPNGKPSGT
jgi:nucleoside-diphosphate-sugar epimerase